MRYSLNLNHYTRICKESVRIAVEALQPLEEGIRKKAAALADIPAIKKLDIGTLSPALAAILFVDLRDSTARTRRLGLNASYITIHALMPLMASLIQDYGGHVIGFRGDGLFGAFGLDDHAQSKAKAMTEMADTVCSAGMCAQAMIQSVDLIINPILEGYECDGNIQIGVGLDAGQVFITRIGLKDVNEVTMYGDAVNTAAKLCTGRNEVFATPRFDEAYPATPGGKVRFSEARDNGPLAMSYPIPLFNEE